VITPDGSTEHPAPVDALEITVIPGQFRPGVGRLPRREGRRPMLPQHARMCGPLEAGSSLGYLVYPALHDHESFQIRRTAPGELLFSFFGGDAALSAAHFFSLRFSIPANGIGVWSEELVFRAPECPLSESEIRQVRDALLRMGSLWVPPGAVALRGAVDFRTPPGWDTVFTGVLNQAQPPPLSTLTGRVETDWYAFDSEFRYVLQVGDVLSGSGRIPVGQAFAVPRVDTDVRQADQAEAAAFRAAQRDFNARKADVRTSNALGLEYDTLYREASRRGARPAPAPRPTA